jgi:nickel-dependent lactate racemase
MLIEIPYGETRLTEEICEIADAKVIQYFGSLESIPNLGQAVINALRNPIGSERLSKLMQPNAKVAIIISDVTRKSPSKIFLDCLAEEFKQVGLPEENVTIVVANGTHRNNTIEELSSMVGVENLTRFKVINHNCLDEDNLVFIGETQGGVPIWINRSVAEASFRIATGVITPHHSAGYSGGRKAILPGVSGYQTVCRHHSYPIHPSLPVLGKMKDNPFHEEALQAAKLLGVNFILNAVPNPSGIGYLGIVAGDLEKAHEAGVDICQKASSVTYPYQADLTICSPGGFPRDINLHQAQKALSVAEMVTRKGGVIILIAECRKGVGSEFAKWLQIAKTPEEVIKRYHRQGWSESSSKAMMFARAALHYTIFLISNSFDKPYLESLFIHKADSIWIAIQNALEILGPNPKTLIIPYASGLIPFRNQNA